MSATPLSITPTTTVGLPGVRLSAASTRDARELPFVRSVDLGVDRSQHRVVAQPLEMPWSAPVGCDVPDPRSRRPPFASSAWSCFESTLTSAACRAGKRLDAREAEARAKLRSGRASTRARATAADPNSGKRASSDRVEGCQRYQCIAACRRGGGEIVGSAGARSVAMRRSWKPRCDAAPAVGGSSSVATTPTRTHVHLTRREG